MFYGYQIFPSKNRISVDFLNLFVFETAAELEMWIDSDMSLFSCSQEFIETESGSDLRQKYRRNRCSVEDAELLIGYGKTPIKLKSNVDATFATAASDKKGVEKKPANAYYSLL